jgi:hypothetical protein
VGLSKTTIVSNVIRMSNARGRICRRQNVAIALEPGRRLDPAFDVHNARRATAVDRDIPAGAGELARSNEGLDFSHGGRDDFRKVCDRRSPTHDGDCNRTPMRCGA